jgi:hypothetical protein
LLAQIFFLLFSRPCHSLVSSHLSDTLARARAYAHHQTSILAIVGNVLAHTVQLVNGERRFDAERACANAVLNVMNALPNVAEISVTSMRLVMRLVQDERVARYLCAAGAAPRLLALLPHYSAPQDDFAAFASAAAASSSTENSDIRRQIFVTLSEVTNSTTAVALLDAGVVRACVSVVQTERKVPECACSRVSFNL